MTAVWTPDTFTDTFWQLEGSSKVFTWDEAGALGVTFDMAGGNGDTWNSGVTVNAAPTPVWTSDLV